MTRFAKRIVIAFDADGAGKAAADRFYEWEDRHNAEVFVAAMPEGADPGQLAEEDPAALTNAVATAEPFLSYRIGRVLDKSDLDRVEGRARAAANTGAIIAEHPNEVVRDQYLVDVAQKLRVDIEQMRRLVVKPAPTRRQSVSPIDSGSDDSVSGDGSEQQAVPQAEMNLLRALVHHSEIVTPLALPSMFSDQLAIDAYHLVTTDGWRDQIGNTSTAVTTLVGRALVEEVSADPIELVSRALDAVIHRWNMELRYDVTEIEQLREHQPMVQWLAQRQEEMHSDDTRTAAVEAVVGWLRSQETLNATDESTD